MFKTDFYDVVNNNISKIHTIHKKTYNSSIVRNDCKKQLDEKFNKEPKPETDSMSLPYIYGKILKYLLINELQLTKKKKKSGKDKGKKKEESESESDNESENESSTESKTPPIDNKYILINCDVNDNTELQNCTISIDNLINLLDSLINNLEIFSLTYEVTERERVKRNTTIITAFISAIISLIVIIISVITFGAGIPVLIGISLFELTSKTALSYKFQKNFIKNNTKGLRDKYILDRYYIESIDIINLDIYFQLNAFDAKILEYTKDRNEKKIKEAYDKILKYLDTTEKELNKKWAIRSETKEKYKIRKIIIAQIIAKLKSYDDDGVLNTREILLDFYEYLNYNNFKKEIILGHEVLKKYNKNIINFNKSESDETKKVGDKPTKENNIDNEVNNILSSHNVNKVYNYLLFLFMKEYKKDVFPNKKENQPENQSENESENQSENESTDEKINLDSITDIIKLLKIDENILNIPIGTEKEIKPDRDDLINLIKIKNEALNSKMNSVYNKLLNEVKIVFLGFKQYLKETYVQPGIKTIELNKLCVVLNLDENDRKNNDITVEGQTLKITKKFKKKLKIIFKNIDSNLENDTNSTAYNI